MGLTVFAGYDWMDVAWRQAPGAARYVVQWRPSAQAAWSGEHEAAAGVGSHSVDGLRAGGRYSVRVRAEDASGTVLSERSSSVTLGVHRPDLTIELQYGKESWWERRKNAWVELAVELPRGLDAPDRIEGLEKFVVQWRRGLERYGGTRRHEMSVDPHRLTINDLDSRFEYAVRVSLVDRRGRVVGVAEATAALRGDAYPLGPTDAPRVDAGGLSLLPGATWIDVVWPAAAAATGHTLQWKPASSAGWAGAEQAGAAADATTHTVEGLTADGRYTVRVRADTADGPGPWLGPAAAALVSAAPRPLSLRGHHQSILASWGPAAGTAAAAAAQYLMQWRSGGEPYDDARSRLMSASTHDAEIAGLDNSVQYTVRLSALDSRGRPLGAAEGSVSPVSMADRIKAEVIDPRLDSHPWLREAWYEAPVEIIGTSDAEEYLRSVPSIYLIPRLFLVPDGTHHYSNNMVKLLAFHFTLHPSIHAGDPVGRLSVLSLWLHTLLPCSEGITCNHPLAIEVIGDVMREFTLHGSSGSAGTDAIAASVSAGELPQWFTDTYTSDGTLATTDLDALWGDLKQVGANPSLDHLPELLAGLFGGLCSTAEAEAALAASASLNNAWADGGCHNRRPQRLAAASGGSGEIEVSWRAPLYSVAPAIDRYVVQWKSGAQSYDTARQAVIADLSDLSHTITGLSTGTEYRIRVAAVNSAGTADLTDSDGRTRTAETTATAG